jgi:YD repeat-containing protein
LPGRAGGQTALRNTRAPSGYDAAGNTISYTGTTGSTLTFNQRGRISVRTVSAGTTNYIYNALGQLIDKSGVGSKFLYMYDEAGHLLGEYNNTGTEKLTARRRNGQLGPH